MDAKQGVSDKSGPPQVRKPLLEWQAVQKKFPWGILLLLGGGFALGDAVKVNYATVPFTAVKGRRVFGNFQKSGLSSLVGNQLTTLGYLGPGGVCAVAVIIMTFATEGKYIKV